MAKQNCYNFVLFQAVEDLEAKIRQLTKGLNDAKTDRKVGVL